jgi:hypothetical protein
LALLHEASLGGAGKALAVATDRFAFAGIAFAFFHKAGFGCAGERLAGFMAWLSQLPCADAQPKLKARINAATEMRFIGLSCLTSFMP